MDRGKIFAVLLQAIILGASFALTVPSAYAQVSITGFGTSSILVSPDEAVVDLEVTSSASRQQDAVEASSRRTERVVRALRGSGIPLSVDEPYVFSVQPRAVGGSSGREPGVSYVVRRVLTLVVRDPMQIDRAVALAQRAGAGQAANIDHRSADLSHHRAKAREQALRQADANAAARAAEVGGSLGRLIRVSEGGSQGFSRRFAGGGGQLADLSAAGESSLGIGPSGRMLITSSVMATYELKGANPNFLEQQRVGRSVFSERDER